MALTAAFKPSHELRSGFPTKTHEVIGQFFSDYFSKLAPNLAELEKPLVQKALQSLSVAPKPRQWTLDQSLSKTVRNSLLTHHLINMSCHSFFDELKQQFFNRLEHRKYLAASLASRRLAKARAAIAYMQALDAELMRQYKDEELRKLRELYNEQTKLIAVMKQDIAMLDAALVSVLEEARIAFVDFVNNDSKLVCVFANANQQQLEQYSDAYIKMSVEHINQIESYRDDIELERAKQQAKTKPKPKLKAKSKPESESSHDKIAQLEKMMREREAQLKQVAVDAAKQCELDSKACEQLAEPEVQEKLAQHFKPAVNDAAAIAKAKLLAEVRLAVTETVRDGMRSLMASSFGLAAAYNTPVKNELNRHNPILDYFLPSAPKPNR